MPDVNLNIATLVDYPDQTCLWNFICANESFVSIYGVIFTIVISLGVYIYGLQDKSEKITLTKKTNIKRVITLCLSFFAFSFILLPNSIYELVNFLLVGAIILNLFIAFNEVFKFNENELSGERAVKKFKEGVIREKLAQFEALKIKNDLLNKSLEEKKGGKDIERFLFDENTDSYHIIRSESSGYITNVDLNVLFAKEIDQASSKKLSYYIPYHISNGSPIEFDTIILGVKKEDGLDIDEERLRSFISISDEYENPTSYLEAETRSYYNAMFSFIKMEDSKGLELKLKEFSSFVDHFTDKADSYVDIIQFINDDIIFPLQKYSFKQGDIDCIRKIVSFSLGYIYQSLSKKSVQSFNIFLRNFSHAFYQSYGLTQQNQSEFLDIYFRWLSEVSKYSIKSKIQKDGDYIEYGTKLLSSLNGSLKIAFDKGDLTVFEKTLDFLNDSFLRESYEHDEDVLLDEIILIKKAVIFGFTAWVYKNYSVRKNQPFYKDALQTLLATVSKDAIFHYRSRQDDLNYYLSVYLKTAEISESKGSFGWDSWDLPEGRVSTITIRDDIKRLLADRILKLIIDTPALTIDIKDQNYNDELSLIKEGSHQFDPLLNQSKDYFTATSALTDEQFTATKIKFYEVFTQINQKYEADVRTKIIEQPLNDSKFSEFAKENFESYSTARVLHRIQDFVRDPIKKADGFGYNILLRKEQFVAETNVHYTNENQFGEDLARSEDNRILESIYKKFTKIPTVKKDKITKFILAEDNLKAIIIWVNGYLNLEDTNPEDFKPYWNESDSKKDNGPYYQGSIGGTPVFIVYKFQEHKTYPDAIFALKNEAFSISEFEIERDANLSDANTKWADSVQDCITMSITNLSNVEDARTKIVEKWIENEPASVTDKQAKIEELKTSVLFHFYKGLSVDSIAIDESKVLLFHIK